MRMYELRRNVCAGFVERFLPTAYVLPCLQDGRFRRIICADGQKIWPHARIDLGLHYICDITREVAGMHHLPCADLALEAMGLLFLNLVLRGRALCGSLHSTSDSMSQLLVSDHAIAAQALGCIQGRVRRIYELAFVGAQLRIEH